MLKLNFVPRYANRLFHKLEVNFVSQSDTIALHNPCNLNIYLMNILGISSTLLVDLIGIKCVVLDHLSTKTMMESCFLEVIDNPIIKSMVTISHFHFGIGKDRNKHVGVDAHPSLAGISHI